MIILSDTQFMFIVYIKFVLFFFLINAETIPRFDMRDKDGIMFDPIAPRAGERLVATCTLVALAPTDKRHVSN